MKKFLMNILKYFVLFIIGGTIYCFIEMMYREYTHWTMGVLGGICFISVGLINELFTWETPLWLQCLIGGVIITVLECITGYIVNIKLGWNVWDYSNIPCSLFNGQINLFFSIAWCFLSVVAITLDDYLRYWWFSEEIPHYKIY